MSDALNALFEKRLAQLDKHRLFDFLELHGLKETCVWVDQEGVEWTLRERLPYLACILDTPCHPQTFQHFINQAPVEKWDAIDDREQRIRAMYWLAVQRQYVFRSPLVRPYDWNNVDNALSSNLKRSFAKQPAGTPASGFGDPNDGGWLATAWQLLPELERQQRQHGPNKPWSRVWAAWVSSALLTGGPFPETSWWRYGGVSQTRVNKNQPGDPGWESLHGLPREPVWLGRASNCRPLQLEGRWHTVAATVLEGLARTMEAERSPRIDQGLFLRAAFQSPQPEQWMSPPMVAALRRIARTALLDTEPVEGSPMSRYDGRGLDALAWLVNAKVSAEWFPLEEQRHLAQALFDHARSFVLSDHPVEQDMGLAEGSILRSYASLSTWAKNILSAPPVRPSGPRP